MDASDLHLGVVIFQKGKCIAFYSCKLSVLKTRYAVIENYFIGIVKT